MSEPSSAKSALSLAAIYLVLSVIWRVLVETASGVAIIGILASQGHSFDDFTPELIQNAMSAPVLAVASMLQLGGLGVIAVALARWSGAGVRDSLSLRRAGAMVWLAAAAGGLTVGFFPGWLAEQIARLVPSLDLGNLELLARTITEAGVVGKVLMLVAVCVFAPVIEELVFRGFLWELLDRAVPSWATWLLTSALFALYHLDPVHVIAVFFTGLFLGWVRWVGGSVGPAIAAHFANNLLAAAFSLWFTGVEEASSSPAGAVLSVVLTATLGAVAWWGSRE